MYNRSKLKPGDMLYEGPALALDVVKISCIRPETYENMEPETRIIQDTQSKLAFYGALENLLYYIDFGTVQHNKIYKIISQI